MSAIAWRWAGRVVGEAAQRRGVVPDAEGALQAERRLADAEREAQARTGVQIGRDRRHRPPEGDARRGTSRARVMAATGPAAGAPGACGVGCRTAPAATSARGPRGVAGRPASAPRSAAASPRDRAARCRSERGRPGVPGGEQRPVPQVGVAEGEGPAAAGAHRAWRSADPGSRRSAGPVQRHPGQRGRHGPGRDAPDVQRHERRNRRSGRSVRAGLAGSSQTATGVVIRRCSVGSRRSARHVPEAGAERVAPRRGVQVRPAGSWPG